MNDLVYSQLLNPNTSLKLVRHVGLRGSATWPCVPCHLSHWGTINCQIQWPHQIYVYFYFLSSMVLNILECFYQSNLLNISILDSCFLHLLNWFMCPRSVWNQDFIEGERRICRLNSEILLFEMENKSLNFMINWIILCRILGYNTCFFPNILSCNIRF